MKELFQYSYTFDPNNAPYESDKNMCSWRNCEESPEVYLL